MKRLRLAALIAFFLGALVLAATPQASAGLFGHKKAAATPSPSPSALPTATPEPPSIAIPRLLARLKAHPTDRQAALELAGVYLSTGQAERALSLTQQLLHAGNKDARIYYLDGYAQELVGNAGAALADFQSASDLDPTNVGILAQLADLYARSGKFALAERVAKRAIIFHKKSSQAYVALGAVYADQQKLDKALAEFAIAQKLAPKDPTPSLQSARIYQQQKQIPKALAAIHSALAISPGDLDLLLFRASLYAAEHNDAKTVLAFDDAEYAATNDEDRVKVLMEEATYFTGEKKYPQALAIFQEALKKFPNSAVTHGAIGDYYAQQKDMKDARAQWLAALKIDPSNPAVLARLSQDALDRHDVVDATGYLSKLVKVRPSAQSYAMLGQVYFYRKLYSKARIACEQSFQADRQPDTLGCIASADYHLHNYGEASQIFDALDRNAPGFLDHQPDMLMVAAETYARNNEKTKAAFAYHRLLRVVARNSPSYRQAIAGLKALSKKPASRR
ncbi:MAG: tetratricopeptide repeat protein [Candidatus Eremiobacteraeota bacterium]|nr:tetratricopeptide repeat protein [Candidatus Eremiobacteraeota bacterium]NNM92900.1 tetratricopeptide repeat protein [Candidatus Eremiobacteraeota bacterium]